MLLSWHRYSTLVAGAFILATAYLFSYLPQITWGDRHPKMSPSIYAAKGPWERVPDIFNKWDVLRYTGIAVKGYEVEDRQNLAFFPGWPACLNALGKLVGEKEWLLGLFAIVLNLALWTLALQTWVEVLNKTPIFSGRSDLPIVRSRFAWLFAFYPTSLFNVVGYAEAIFLLVAGLCVLALLEDRVRQMILLIPALILLKHIGITVGLALLAWLLLFRRGALGWALIGYLLGVAFILFFYYRLTGDPFSWAKIQSHWGRHLSLPYAVLLDTRGRAVELIAYAVYLFLGPVLLVRLAKRTGIAEPANLLALAYSGAILLPVWFGGSIHSIYRVIYLVPFLLALIPTFFSPDRARGWVTFFTLMIAMNLHATYRYVQNLFIN